jgi:uncharacterized protein with FMN-binding domain
MRNQTNKIVAGIVSGIVVGSIGTGYLLPQTEEVLQTAAASRNVQAVPAGQSAAKTPAVSSGTTGSTGSAGTQGQAGATVPGGARGGSVPTGGEEGRGKHHQGAASLESVQSVDVASGQYKDGSYTGEAVGYAPGIQVQVTIADSRISAIKITKHNETPGFYETAFKVIPQAIIASQSTKVDTISRATYSCIGIINAVNDALADAKA